MEEYTMLINWIFAGIAALGGYYTMSNQIRHPDDPPSKEQDLAVNMSVYRTSVTRYAAAHPEFTGTVTDANLVFPSWYQRHPQWTNQVSNGTVAIYPASLLPVSLATNIVKLSQNSMLAGVVHNAALYSPVFGETGIPVPTNIPEGAPVWLARIQ
jgi:PilM